MLRIDTLRVGDLTTALLAGKLADVDVSVFTEFLTRHGLPGQIDLSQLVFVDAEGAKALLRAEAEGAHLTRVQPLISLLIESHR